MASSLTLGPFDLLDPTSPVLLAPGFDRGAPSPTVSEIVSTVLDGSAVTGRAAGNRHISLPLVIQAPTRLDGAGLTNQLLTLVDQPTWTLTFTPDGGLPIVFDCYRATATITSDLIADASGFQSLLVQCEALPYGRSPTVEVVTVSGASPQVIDSFEAGPAPTLSAVNGAGGSPSMSSPAYVTTPTPPQGTHSLRLTLNPKSSTLFAVDGTLTRSGLSITTTSDTTAVTFSLGQDGTSTPFPFYVHWSASLSLTTSAGVFAGSVADIIVKSATFATVTVSLDGTLPAGSTITGWSLRIASQQSHAVSPSQTYPTHAFIDQFNIVPPSTQTVSDTQGLVAQFNGVTGTARTAASVAVQRSSGANFSSWLVHTPPPDTPNSQPLIPMGGAGNATVVQTQAGVQYGGTYSVWICYGTVWSAGTARAISVGFGQSNTGLGDVVVSATVSPTTGTLVYVGEVVLPTFSYPDDAAPSVYTTVYVSAPGTDTSTYNDILLLDTRGQTILVDSTAPSKKYAWADAPDPTTSIGGIYSGTAADRSDAVSIASALASASPLLLNPGSARMLLFSPQGLLSASLTYSPRWLQEASQ